MGKNTRKTALIFFIVLALGFLQFACDPNNDGSDDNSTSTTTTHSGGINPSACIPCGDLILACSMNCEITGCPKCMDFDEQNGEMKMVYDDGAYFTVSDDGSMIFYDNTGKQCFKMEVSGSSTTYYSDDNNECYSVVSGPGDDAVTFIVDGKEYIYHDDETWECPDGSTWELPSTCEQADDGQDNMPDTSNCPPVTGICE